MKRPKQQWDLGSFFLYNWLTHLRVATGGKAAKAWSLAGFWETEICGGSSGVPVKWQPLWRPCLPQIYGGGPGMTALLTVTKTRLDTQGKDKTKGLKKSLLTGKWWITVEDTTLHITNCQKENSSKKIMQQSLRIIKSTLLLNQSMLKKILVSLDFYTGFLKV